ncbi:MAG TPA: hypothetical protein VGE26_10455 [Sphingobacteriaceae bacterium]
MRSLQYQEHLFTTCQQLYADMMWFTRCAAYLAFCRELKVLWNVFEPGDKIPIGRDFLKSVNDPAVQRLTRWIIMLGETLFSLRTANALDADAIKAEAADHVPERSGQHDDAYAAILNSVREHLFGFRFYLIDYILELAQDNPLCEDNIQQFAITGNANAFANTPDENVNKLYLLFLVAAEVTGELSSVTPVEGSGNNSFGDLLNF